MTLRTCQRIPSLHRRECDLEPSPSVYALKMQQTKSAYSSIRACEPDVLPDSNVRERAGVRVDERVQETKYGLPCCDELVVDERNNTCKGRRRCRGASDETCFSSNDDLKVPALCRNLENRMVSMHWQCRLKAEPTSGYPRLVLLNTPGKSDGTVSRNWATAADWYEGCANRFEKPPPVKLIARSGLIPRVEPTAVTKGQDAGNTGIKVLSVH